MPINPNYSPRSGAYGSTSPYDTYDPQTIQMMKEMGIYHPALSLNPRSPQGQQEAEIMQHIQQLRAHEMQRQDEEQARTQVHNENVKQREEAVRLQEQGRNERASELHGIRSDALDERTTQGLLAGVNAAGYMGPAGQKMQQALMAEYMKQLGINTETAVPKPQGEFGPKGPATSPAASTSPSIPTLNSTSAGSPRMNIPLGRTTADAIRTAPAGYDVNANTGEYVRKDQPQYINGSIVGAPPLVAKNTNPPPPESGGTLKPSNAFQLEPTQQPTGPIGPPTSYYNINSGVTPEGAAANKSMLDFLSQYLNLPKTAAQQKKPVTPNSGPADDTAF